MRAAAGPSCEDAGHRHAKFSVGIFRRGRSCQKQAVSSPPCLVPCMFHILSVSCPQPDESGPARGRRAVPLSAPWQLPFICIADADVGQKRRKSLPHLLVWSRGDGWMGTAMKRPPSFPPLPPRNCLSAQFLPHVCVSHPSPSPSICSWTAFLPAAISLQPSHLAVANLCQRLCVIYTMTSPSSNEYEHVHFSLAGCSLVCLPGDKLTR